MASAQPATTLSDVPQRCKDLIAQGDYLFTKRQPLMSLWQEIADNFYPERADFTVSRNLGIDFAANLITSYPVMARRDLGTTFSAMLRPTDKDWFNMGLSRDDRADTQGKRWLEWSTKLMRNAMYDRNSQFVRATKEGDHDFAAFGQAVISVELNRNADGLLYRCWHLRDVVWSEDSDGQVRTFHRKWKPTARDLNLTFKGRISPKVSQCLDKEPYKEINCRHIIIPTEYYDCEGSGENGAKWKRFPFMSIYIDVDNQFIMEEIGTYNPMYTVPRWQTVSGSQYAFSPATVVALPDARLIQAQTLTLLESGEKAASPPIIATEDAVRGDVNIQSAGITWVDREYDEKMGAALRPLELDHSGMPVGLQLRENTKQSILEAFYLNKIGLPPMGKDMTAFEVGQRVAEYIRNALPLFEPMETDYNGSLCENTFNVMLRANAFGAVADIPRSLRNQEIQFRFESPLHEAVEKQKGAVFMQGQAYLTQAYQIDPTVKPMIDARTALREVLEGTGLGATWIRDDKEMDAINAQEAKAAQTQNMMATIQQGAMAAKTVGEANQAIQGVPASSYTS